MSTNRVARALARGAVVRALVLALALPTGAALAGDFGQHGYGRYGDGHHGYAYYGFAFALTGHGSGAYGPGHDGVGAGHGVYGPAAAAAPGAGYGVVLAPCEPVQKVVYDGYGRRLHIGGTLCYDHRGGAYIVPGSRYLIGTD